MQSSSEEVMGREAELAVRLPNGRIKCTACARLCEIPEGKTGLCGIRGVTNSSLYLYVYGRVIAGHIDPIEKKPVTHYKPGTAIYSIATTGCNWLCKYCQNYDISHILIPNYEKGKVIVLGIYSAIPYDDLAAIVAVTFYSVSAFLI